MDGLDLSKFKDIDFSKMINIMPPVYPKFDIPELPRIDYKDTPGYKLQQIVEQGEKQIKELETANEYLDNQVKLLIQQLEVSHEHKKLLETQLENEKIEKANAIKESKKNKKWSVTGKLLSGLIALIVFVITIFTTIYTDESKEIINLIWKTIFPNS